jgi:AraC-like DNA-binding protein
VLVEFSDASVFVHGPLFFLYTLSLSDTRFQFERRHLSHFLPFAICLAILLPGAITGHQVPNAIRQGLTILKMISLLLYTVAVILKLRGHRRRVETIFSNTEHKYLGWLKFLAWGIITVWLVAVTGLLVYTGPALNLSLSFFVFLIGYFGVRQEAIFDFSRGRAVPDDDNNITDLVEQKPDDKYRKSGLSRQRSVELFNFLTKEMNERKLYRDPELTSFTLAEQLKVHPNHLSQVINQHSNQNFFEYVNTLRINDVKEALQEPKFNTHSLLGIAFEFGFNSKASFNRAFKKITGMTPSEYKKASGKGEVRGEG